MKKTLGFLDPLRIRSRDFYIVARERRYENIYQHDRASLPIFLHTFGHVYKDFYIVARERRYENIYQHDSRSLIKKIVISMTERRQ